MIKHLSNGLRKHYIVSFLIIIILALGFYGYFLHTRPQIKSTQIESDAGLAMGGAPISQADKKFADISKLGFTWVRFDISWYKVQPKNSKQYNWAAYDGVIASANRNHLKVLGILDSAPPWAAQQGCINPGSCPPKDATQFATFAAEAAKHYGHGVQNWEIWNEENISQFWSPSPNIQQYADVLKQSYKSIKAVSPTASIIVGGTAAGDNHKAAQIDAVVFLKSLYEAGVKGSFDAVAYHPYTYPSNPSRFNAWNKLSNLHSAMQSYGDGTKKIWITEYGAPTYGPENNKFVSEAAQAQMAQNAFKNARSKPWIGPFFWYTYQDKSSKTSTVENFFGIRRADGKPKPSYYTWQELIAQKQKT